MKPGEENAIDFNFEDLEFIEDDGKIIDEGIDPNTTITAEEEEAAAEAARLEAEAVEAAKTEEDNKQAQEEAAEAARLEGVSGEPADDKTEGGTSPQLFQELTTLLKEEGVLSSADDSSLTGVKGSEDLVELIKAQIKSQELSDLNDVQKQVLDDMRAGVSTEVADQYKRAMDQLEDITDTQIKDDKQVRFDLIYQDFVSKGFDTTKAARYANLSFDTKQDLIDAQEAKANLKKTVTSQYETKKTKELEAVEAEKAKKKKSEETLKDTILKTEEVVTGFKIPENVRKEVLSGMNTMISTNPETGIPENSLMKHQREDPVDFGHKLYFLYKVTNGFKDFNYFGKKSASGTVKNLEKILRHSAHVSGGGNPDFTDDGESSLFDVGSPDDLVIPGQ